MTHATVSTVTNTIPLLVMQQALLSQGQASALVNTVVSTTGTGGNTWSSAHSNATTSVTSTGTHLVIPVLDRQTFLASDLKVPADYTGEIALPDGTVIKISAGAFTIEDSDARIVYRANRTRDFNRYLNASDLLEEFIGYLGSLGLGKTDVLQIPVELFIMWVVIRAAEQDGEPAPQEQEQLRLASRTLQLPRCRCCGRFISHRHQALGVQFCSGEHMDKWMNRN